MIATISTLAFIKLQPLWIKIWISFSSPVNQNLTLRYPLTGSQPLFSLRPDTSSLYLSIFYVRCPCLSVFLSIDVFYLPLPALRIDLSFRYLATYSFLSVYGEMMRASLSLCLEYVVSLSAISPFRYGRSGTIRSADGQSLS